MPGQALLPRLARQHKLDLMGKKKEKKKKRKRKKKPFLGGNRWCRGYEKNLEREIGSKYIV